MEEREAREKEEEAQKQRKEAKREETTHSPEEGVTENHARTGKSDTEMDTEGGEAMTNIYLTDSDEEAIVDFVKDHQQLYGKTNEHF